MDNTLVQPSSIVHYLWISPQNTNYDKQNKKRKEKKKEQSKSDLKKGINESAIALTSESRRLNQRKTKKIIQIEEIVSFYFSFIKSRYRVIWTRREEKSSLRYGHILAGNQRSGPVKVSIVGGGQGGSKIWRRERIEMTDPDLDDVAFLSGVYMAQETAWPAQRPNHSHSSFTVFLCAMLHRTYVELVATNSGSNKLYNIHINTLKIFLVALTSVEVCETTIVIANQNKLFICLLKY